AAAFAACKARELGADVILVDKAFFGRSGCSALASGVFSFYQPGDDWQAWMGRESNPLCNQKLFGEELPRTYEALKFMEEAGVKLVKDGEKVLRVAGPSMAMPHQAMLAEGGPQMTMALRSEALRRGARVANRVLVTGLLTSDGALPTQGRVTGTVGFNTRTGQTHVFQARAVIMATGPFDIPYNRQELAYSTRHMPIDASGEGVAAMFDAGAICGKLELGAKSASPVGLSCAPALEMLTALGDTAIWVNRDGERFIPQDFRRLGWGRSAITHTILHESLSGKGPVGINISHFSPEQRRLLKQVVPIVVENFESAGYDLTKDTIPYTVGVPLGKAVNGAGARINRRGETSVPGLYAAGNCSDGGYIGLGQTLNLCALNGWWAGEAATASLSQAGEPQVPEEQLHSHEESYLGPLKARDGLAFYEVRDKITDVQLSLLPTMNDDKLRGALHRLERAMEEDLPRLAAREPRELVKVNGLRAAVPLLRLSLMVMRHRTESRGNLLREDYPFIDNVNWLVHTVVQKRVNGSLELWDIPIPEEWWVNKPERRQVPHPFFQM
ncbi:MAG TPA: FAD-binding protein, partial [Dehalococcoidia bacterium]|nr:FAD-binding protein [Dehalococcoidia bacterium]